MSAVPQRRPIRARRRRHGGALLAAFAYGVAAFAVYHLVVPSLGHEAERAADVPSAAAAPPPTTQLGTASPREVLALRAVSARVQRSVYTVQVGKKSRGSGFVGWVRNGKVSFVVTARAAVTGSAGAKLSVQHGEKSLPAKVVRSDPATGLALLRVNTALDRPLWQRAGDRAALKADTRAVVVPAGKTGDFGQGVLARADKSFSLHAGDGQLQVGAPVLADDGRLAGIVVEHTSSGGSRIVSLADACGHIRSCG